jgi:hypothetical protein
LGLTGRPRQRRNRRLFFPGARNLARLGPDDLRFDQNVIGTADHHQMFDIVAPHEHELALPVEVEGIDHAEAWLPRPAAARHMKPAAESQPKNEQNQKSRNEKCNSAR